MHCRGLARAVGTKQREDGSLGHVQVDAVEDHVFAKSFAQSPCFNHHEEARTKGTKLAPFLILLGKHGMNWRRTTMMSRWPSSWSFSNAATRCPGRKLCGCKKRHRARGESSPLRS